jgi:hypothetical protein
MTDTVNVLPHLRELRAAWRQQDFQFTKEQQEEYDILTIARQERVKYFCENGLVSKGSKVLTLDEVQEPQEVD